MQDPNWRELLRHCAARGAYLGAGASQMEGLMRQGVSTASPALSSLQDTQGATSEVSSGSLQLAHSPMQLHSSTASCSWKSQQQSVSLLRSPFTHHHDRDLPAGGRSRSGRQRAAHGSARTPRSWQCTQDVP